ncbi:MULTISPECIES: 2-amino-4-hydroxy-6-hydroxymethyldihydropteridine diphosphokinase [Psychrobacter]|uniref:2-amino-4-hydroxy-6- hydroxymethyldihydropteridine diphosphokinase n=1 Tax=Psychrobacter TaxID=497 RepID=UPI00146BB1E3|nr:MULTISPECIES: 2-amino-4-hydroxy-6-hydroxymethyldihydropteridine diphosphokinase [Psychrobacter]
MSAESQTPNQNWTQCYLGLGSNLANELGTPIEHLTRGIAKLKANSQIRNLVASSFYGSIPMGPQDQPDFVNAVVGFETNLTPIALLDVCQALETDARRERLRHWGERSLDVDVLLFGDQEIHEPRLIVPHLGITERNFVLVPLIEIAPNLIINGTPISSYPESQNLSGIHRICDADQRGKL